jgi:methylmalonyl-CoA mutase
MAQELGLTADFPPTTTAEWEEQIVKDLKGADYEKRLVWRTDEGIAVRPYYRSEDITLREPLPNAAGTWEMVLPGSEPALSVSAVEAHEQGATAVQEVAYALAQGADLLASGLDVTTMGFAIGSNHFMEIAKLRSARRLWSGVASAFGVQGDVRIHARTAGENKTLYDPYVNMLRVTTEALSAVLGGCDSLTITPCGFDPHLAENVHHVLREEGHLDKVLDPGAGSYYVEALTDALSAEAWKLFQAIEAGGSASTLRHAEGRPEQRGATTDPGSPRAESRGGWRAYRVSGALAAALTAGRAAKEKAVAERRRVLVGTNSYPDLGERQLHSCGRLDAGWRLAEFFEAIRLRTERHAASTGRVPRVLLLERGDPKMRNARSTFCLNLFGCAGFEILQSETLAEADLVVLCSADREYVDLAREIAPQVRVPVIVAGYPTEHLEALRAAGVAGFVHARSNAVETLREWQDRLGVEE